MSLNALLDIAIGLLTMYLVLALACTSINELISSVFKLRSGDLRNALQKLIDDPALRNTFDGHGLIACAKKSQNSDPSYISGQTFALVLLDSLTPPGQVTTLPAAQAAAQALPPSHIRDVVLSNIALAAGNIDKLREGLAQSFDRAMDRVSGVYSRRIKWISLLVGIGLATALNADSIAVAQALWADKPRAEMLELARKVLSEDALSRNALTKDASIKDASIKDASIKPTASRDASGKDATAKESDGQDKYRAVVTNVEEAVNKLRPLPLGWDFSKAPSWLDALLKPLGLFLTGLALMFGAPFWFDTLSKVTNLRMAGEKPTKTVA